MDAIFRFNVDRRNDNGIGVNATLSLLGEVKMDNTLIQGHPL
ncbi:hypothetical protein [Neobacillus paridis]|nr:hypothetical protein [Neobacillus paridis]